MRTEYPQPQAVYIKVKPVPDKTEFESAGTELIPEPTAEEYSLLKKLSQYVRWGADDPRTADCPLIPFRLTAEGVREAADDEYEDRDVPYYLRGRGDEFNFLARRLVQKPSPVTLVTGPPGTGKSALLATVAEYAKRIGHIVVELEPLDLADAATIAQKCRAAAMTAADAPGHRETTRTVKGGGTLSVAAEKLFARIGMEIQFTKEKSEHRKDIGNIDLIKHLRAVCHYKGKNRRLLIYVDEAQKIAEVAAASAAHEAAIGNNLYILNDRLLQGKENLPVTTILAGLTPARDIIEQFISRPASGCDLELTPIAPPYIQQILNDYLTIDEPCKVRPSYFPKQLLRRWSDECQGHVLLANQLGFKLQEYAIEHIQLGIPFQIDDDGNKTIPLAANFNETIRTDYYTRQLPKSMQGPVADIVHHLVQASIDNHDPGQHLPPHTQLGNVPHPITWPAAIALAKQALKTFSEEDSDEPMPTVQQALRLLQHKGVIRRMRPTPHFLRLHRNGPIRPEEHCAIPIPTITEYMTERYAKLTEAKRERIQRNVQQIMQDFPRDIGTQWQWGNVARRSPVPCIPEVQYEATPSPIPLPLAGASPIHFAECSFDAVTPHYDQWVMTPAKGQTKTKQTISFQMVLDEIRALEKQDHPFPDWHNVQTHAHLANNDCEAGPLESDPVSGNQTETETPD